METNTKKLGIALISLLLPLSLAACTVVGNTTLTTSGEPDLYLDLSTFKGLEVYCWKVDDTWLSGAMSGTNRTKTSSEIDALVGITLPKMKETIKTYDGYMDITWVYAVNRPCSKADIASGFDSYDRATINYLRVQLGLNEIEEPPSPTSVTLKSLYPWMDGLEKCDIVSAMSSDLAGSIAPCINAFNSHYRLTTDAEREKLVSFFDAEEVIITEDPHWTGGSTDVLSVVLDHGVSHSISSYNNGFTLEGIYYEYQHGLPSFSTFYGYSYVSQAANEFSLYVDGVKMTGSNDLIYSMRFVEEKGTVERMDDYEHFLFRSDFGNIQFLNHKTFQATASDGEYETVVGTYTIVNDVEFSDLESD